METLEEVLVGRSTEFVIWTLHNYLTQINRQISICHDFYLNDWVRNNHRTLHLWAVDHFEELESEKRIILTRIEEEMRNDF